MTDDNYHARYAIPEGLSAQIEKRILSALPGSKLIPGRNGITDLTLRVQQTDDLTQENVIDIMHEHFGIQAQHYMTEASLPKGYSSRTTEYTFDGSGVS